MGRKVLKTLLLIVIISGMLVSQPVFARDSSGKTDEDGEVSYLKSVMEMIKEKYKGEITDKQLIEGALKGMFGTMDPYTAYYTADEANSFFSDIEGRYKGIGVMMTEIGNYAVITKVFPSSPAERAGIVAGDKIASVDGVSVIGQSTDKIAALIKGEQGTRVTLGIIRSGVQGEISVDVIREEIKVNPVTYEIRNGIGYIKIDTFNLNTDEFMTEALNKMDSMKIDRIILDLRNNPGGDVDQAVAVARKFVPEGLITKLDFKSESISDREYYSYLKNLKYKLVVLVNGMSASASEILAGAVQDTRVGTLIGTKTFGKAKVQNLIPLLTPEAYKKYAKQLGVDVVDVYDLITKYGISPADSEIIGWTKITTGEYTTPKGRMIDQVGLIPDVQVEDYALVNDIDINSIQKLTKTQKPNLNSEGMDVYNAEKILKICGYEVDPPDMKLDDRTFRAIAKFQQDSGLFPYGVLDYSTQQALNNKLDKLLTEIDKQYAKAVEVLSK